MIREIEGLLEMSKEKKKNNSLRNGIVISIVLICLKLFVWDQYVVNSTVADALAETDGEPGVGTPIHNWKNAYLAVRPSTTGFHVYGLSKNFFGWKVTDEVFVTVHDESHLFEENRQTFLFENGKEVSILLVATSNQAVDSVIAKTAEGDVIHFNRIGNQHEFLYYQYVVGKLGEVTYEALSHDGEVLGET